jgi:uncharacterized protein YacL
MNLLLITSRVVFFIVCTSAIAMYLVSTNPSPPELLQRQPLVTFVVLLLLTQSATIIDMLLPKKRIEIISSVYFGLLIGFLISSFTNQALAPSVPDEYRYAVQLVINLMMPYICVSVLLQTKDQFRFIIPYIEFSKEVKGGRPFVLDTSSIIDGRIADVIETKILDATLIVPTFVLKELQDIADSNDKLRRNRGRRGLDVLSRLQTLPNVEIKLQDFRGEELDGLSVDQRLVMVAKQLGGRVVTSDFNLNKVAGVHGVDVVNLNDLANSLKPRYLPGERLVIKVIKPGEGVGQGVGYLDDGTMVVCEDGSGMIGREIDIVVKSVLQSSAGRMIFGRLPTAAER